MKNKKIILLIVVFVGVIIFLISPRTKATLGIPTLVTNAKGYSHVPQLATNISYFSKGEVLFALELSISEKEFIKWCKTNYGLPKELEHPTSILRYTSFNPMNGQIDNLEIIRIKNGLLWMELSSSVKKLAYNRDNQTAYYEFGF